MVDQGVNLEEEQSSYFHQFMCAKLLVTFDCRKQGFLSVLASLQIFRSLGRFVQQRLNSAVESSYWNVVSIVGVFWCTVLHRSTAPLPSVVFRGEAWACLCEQRTAPHRSVLNCATLHCTALHWSALPHTALICTLMHCTASHSSTNPLDWECQFEPLSPIAWTLSGAGVDM